MKHVVIVSSLLMLSPLSELYARRDEGSGCPPSHYKMPPPPPYFVPGQKMGKDSLHRPPRVKSELQIRARLKERYGMSEKDINTVLKARKEILDIMEKYRVFPDDRPHGILPPPPLY